VDGMTRQRGPTTHVLDHVHIGCGLALGGPSTSRLSRRWLLPRPCRRRGRRGWCRRRARRPARRARRARPRLRAPHLPCRLGPPRPFPSPHAQPRQPRPPRQLTTQAARTKHRAEKITRINCGGCHSAGHGGYSHIMRRPLRQQRAGDGLSEKSYPPKTPYGAVHYHLLRRCEECDWLRRATYEHLALHPSDRARRFYAHLPT
jgi:hypothetical protein